VIVRAWAIAVALAAGAAPAWSGAQDACRADVERQLRAWQHRPPPRTQPPTLDGATVRHWPTDRLGTWVVERSSTVDTTLTRIAPDEALEVTWTSDCIPRETRRPRPPIAAPRFSDDDLRRLLDASPAGVIYLWSPHMPLSVDGVAQARAAAKARTLEVTVLLDPQSNRDFAARVAAERGLPADALRAADSVELTFRDVLVHAPSLQAYAHGQLRGSPFPGYHTADEYGGFVDRVLGAAPRAALVACPRGISTACGAGHPASLRCSSLRYRPISSLLAPCDPGAAPRNRY
jgi:hypothetical protein